jgi:hypothetical protein
MAAAGSAYVLHSLVKCSIYASVIVPDGLHIYRRPRTRRITLSAGGPRAVPACCR